MCIVSYPKKMGLQGLHYELDSTTAKTQYNKYDKVVGGAQQFSSYLIESHHAKFQSILMKNGGKTDRLT